MTVTFEMDMPKLCEDFCFVYITEGAYKDYCNFPNSEVKSEEIVECAIRRVAEKCPLKQFNITKE